MKINISIQFKGNCEEAINFYKDIFNGSINKIVKFKDMPKNDKFPIKDEDLEKVMHSEISITDNLVIMATDDIMGISSIGSNVTLSLNFTNEENIDSAKNIFDSLAIEGNVIMPYGKTFWGAYYGQVVDKFGIKWEVNYQL